MPDPPMLSVIIEARDGTEGLAALLAQLTAGAVDGIVREVRIVAAPDQQGIALFCEETGAAAHESLEAAAQAARSETVMVLPSDFRFRDGWIGALNAHVAAGATAARVVGLGGRGFGRSPEGVLVARGVVAVRERADLQQLRRGLGLRAGRVG